jgi:hypothetical protein
VSKSISVRRAVVVGSVWLLGSSLTGALVPMLALGLADSVGILDRISGKGSLVLVLGCLLFMLPASWLGWSTQVPRWRVWAYRRVADIDALKVAAVSAGLIWPDGHLFERTELRSRDQAVEIRRLELASSLAQVSGAAPVKMAPTKLGDAADALAISAGVTIFLALMAACLLWMVGLSVLFNPVFIVLVVLSLTILGTLIYRRARRERVSGQEAFRQILPVWLRRKDPAD